MSVHARSLLRRFDRLYFLLIAPLNVLGILFVGILWNADQPSYDYDLTISQPDLFGLLVIPALLITVLSFVAQRKLLVSMLKRGAFQPILFTVFFYGANLFVSIATSFVAFPLLIMLFFFAFLPIYFVLVPTHLVGGIILAFLLRKSPQTTPAIV